MFSRNPNDPAQITIRLANERVVLEAPKLREQIAVLIHFVNGQRENLAAVEEKANDGGDYAKLRERIINGLVDRLKPATKTSAQLRKMAKRATIYVREPLAGVDSALHQMSGTVESLREEKLAEFCSQFEFVAQSLSAISRSFDRLATTAQNEKNRTLFSQDVVVLLGVGISLALAAFLMGLVGFDYLHRAWRPDMIANGVVAAIATFMLATLFGSVAVTSITLGVKSVVEYFRATAPDVSGGDEEREASA
jgi:hypothetical protein